MCILICFPKTHTFFQHFFPQVGNFFALSVGGNGIPIYFLIFKLYTTPPPNFYGNKWYTIFPPNRRSSSPSMFDHAKLGWGALVGRGPALVSTA